MKILGVSKNGKYLDYAVVEDGTKIVKTGISEATANPSQQLAKLFKQENANHLAITAELESEIPEVLKDKVIVVNAEVAETHISWLDDDLLVSVKYPYMHWQDSDKGTFVSLVNSPKKITTVLDVAQGASRLIKTISKTLGDDFYKMVEQGDDSVYDFNPVLQGEEFDLIKLNEQLKTEIANYQPTALSVDAAVASELRDFYLYDLAAGLHEALINSIIVKFIKLGDDLGIDAFVMGGDFSFNPRMQKLLIEVAAASDLKVHFNNNPETTKAAGIAGLAYYK